MAEIQEDLKEIKATVKGIYKILNGNGSIGLCTKVELHEQKLKSMPSPNSLRIYAAAGGGFILVLGLLGYAVVRTLTG